jgi:hypothetical protein
MTHRKLFTAASALSALAIAVAVSTPAMANDVIAKKFKSQVQVQGSGTVANVALLNSKAYAAIAGINANGGNVRVDDFNSTAVITGTVANVGLLGSTASLSLGGIQANSQ